MAKIKDQKMFHVYLVIFFILSFLIGYVGKKILKPKITMGFDDSKVVVVNSNVDFKEIEEKLKKEFEERKKQAQNQAAPAQPANQQGGSCGN
ncbi:MAG: hypothetical protein GF332_01380 [Candidatus Moranbacteria bacterium]|nr:hypothetical protein [Candidatus Moranbacteria bacterium]